MKKFNQIIFLACGLLLTLAAASVSAQETVEPNEKPLEGFAQGITQKVESGQVDQESVFRPNKKPLEKFAQIVKEKVENKQVDLTKSFSVEMVGVLKEDGKLDPKTSKFTKGEGDEAMIEVGKSFIEAFNDSGLFYYLKQMGIEKIRFVFGQDETRTYGVITSEMPTAEKAKTIASGMNTLLGIAKMSLQQRQNNEDEENLINGALVRNTGKTLTLKMDYGKSVIQEMINRKLKESAAKQSNDE